MKLFKSKTEDKNKTTLAEELASENEVIQVETEAPEVEGKEGFGSKLRFKKKGEKSTKPKKRGKIGKGLDVIARNKRRAQLCTIGVLATMTLVALAYNKIYDMRPYEFTVDDQTVCYVKTQEEANKVVDDVLSSYVREGTTIRAIDTEDLFTVKKSSKFKVDETKLMSAEDATQCVKDSTAGQDGGAQMTIASTETKVEKFTPEPNYQKDDSMLAGQSRVTVKAVEGTRRVSTTYVTVNGEETGQEVTATEILDEGSPATIYKGTLGLPDGEDWETYEGDPVYKDGAELITTAKSYVGKVKYKWGGRNLETGVSCLGFVRAIYAKYGISLPMSHPGMKSSVVAVSYKNAQKGDIICYKAHVGIYVGNGKMVDATSGAGVSVRSVSTSKLVTVRRIVKK